LEFLNQDHSMPSMGFRWQRRLALLGALILPLLLIILYRYPPTENSFYPRCALYQLTGLHCPGCGATRCVHSLLHGEFRQAAGFNLLFLLALPFLLFAGARTLYYHYRGSSPPASRLPAWSIRLLFVVVIAFAVLRNLPIYPANLLAPHLLKAPPTSGGSDG
jgi:hypothetical protein